MATLFLLVIYAAFISLGLPDGLLGVAWPVMQPTYGVPVSMAGVLSMVVSINTIISSALSGRVLQRFGTGWVTFVSVLMTATSLLGIALAPDFIWLVLLGVPLGLGAGSVDAGLNNYVAKHYQAHHMNWLHCFWGIGAMSGPIIISRFISAGESWRNGYLTVSLVQFGLTVLLFVTLPIWDKVAKQKGDTAVGDLLVGQTETPKSGQHGFFYPMRLAGVKPALLVFLFYCAIEATMGLWGSSFLIEVKGLDVATAATWVSLFFGSITLGRFLSGFVTLRMSSKTLIRVGQIAILMGALCFLLPLPEFVSMVGFVFIGFGCAPIFPTMLHETPARFGDEDAENIMGFQMAVAYIGATFLAPLFGVVAEATTFAIFPLFLLLYIVLMFINSEQLNRFMAAKQA